MRHLPRAVDVPEAQRDVLRAVQPVPRREVFLTADLRRAVWGERPQRRRLGRRPVALAVRRAAGGCEHDLRAVPARGLEDPDRSEHVDVGIVGRAVDRHADVGLGGEVEHDLRLHGVENRVRFPDVGHVQLRRGRDVLARAFREVVERVHLVPAVDKRVDEVRSDEPCPPGHDRAHFPMVEATCS